MQEAEKTTTQAEYSPNDLTEIELKEGSTYLISDFVPPAETKDFAAAAQAAMEKSKAELAATNTQSSTFIEEVVPAAKNKQPAELATEKAATEEKPAAAEAAIFTGGRRKIGRFYWLPKKPLRKKNPPRRKRRLLPRRKTRFPGLM